MLVDDNDDDKDNELASTEHGGSPMCGEAADEVDEDGVHDEGLAVGVDEDATTNEICVGGSAGGPMNTAPVAGYPATSSWANKPRSSA